MDQNAFRSLLSAPREGQASGSSSRGGAVLGKHAPKRGGGTAGGGVGGGGAWGIKPREGKVYEKPKEEVEEPSAPAFAPRTHRKLDSRYKDRAEMRRQGVDDEYKGVEKLLEDFEKRKATATGDEADEIEKQRQYLGGDATHSILVKGLDYGLLAARKAELAREKEEDVDDELDELGKGLGERKPAKPKEPGAPAGGEQMAGRFKSIGGKPDPAESKFKSIGAGAGGEGKKKKKRKKKLANETVEQGQAGDSIASSSKAPAASSAPTKVVEKLPTPAPKVEEVPVDDDEDIFADAGTYDLNIAVDDEESEGSVPEDDGREDGDRRGRSRSGSKSRSRSYESGENRGESRYSRSMSRSRSRSRSYDSRDDYGRNEARYSPERRNGGTRYRSRSRSRSRERYRRNYSPPRGGGQYRSRSRSRERSPRGQGYRGDYYRSDDSSDRRGNSYGRYRSSSPRYESRNRRRSYSRSPSRSPPYTKRPRREPPRSRSPSVPPAQRHRTRTRSLTPPLFNNPIPLSPRSPRSRSPHSPGSPRGGMSSSPTPSDESDRAGQVLGGKLVPLSGSTMSDVKSFLASAQAGAEAEEKKMRKAQWRLKQGLGLQEGVTADMVAEYNKELDRRKEEAAERGEAGSSGGGGRGGRGGGRGGRGGRGGVGSGRGGKAESGESREDRRRAQREYQLIMNKMNKDGGGGGGGGGGDGGDGGGDD